MYVKMKTYAQTAGLTENKKEDMVYGQINGFFIVIKQDPAVLAHHTINLWVKAGRINPSPTVVDYLNQCTGKFKYLKAASYSGSKITAEFQGHGFQWSKQYVPCVDEFLKELTAYCVNNEMVQACQVCQEEKGISLYSIEGESQAFCSACFARATEQIKSTIREQKKKSSNIIGGIVGALLGSLIGVLAWVLIYQLGYISAIAGAIMVICAMKGYSLLGGKLNTPGVIICCLISLAMIFFAEQLSLSIAIFSEFKDYYEITFFEAFQSVPAFLEEPEIKNAYIFDIVLGCLLTAVGAGGTVWQAIRASRGVVETKMIVPIVKADDM